MGSSASVWVLSIAIFLGAIPRGVGGENPGYRVALSHVPVEVPERAASDSNCRTGLAPATSAVHCESSPDLALRRRFLAAGSERTALPRRLHSWYFSQVIWF
jgi:hypothetical protein